MRHIGDLIYSKRKQLKITQNVLSQKVKVHRTTLSKIENGDMSPTLEVLERIVEIGFDMDFGEFILLYKKAVKNPNTELDDIAIDTSELNLTSDAEDNLSILHHLIDQQTSHIGDLIQSTRVKLSITQSELAVRSNVSQATISYIESGRVMPTFDILEKIIINGFDMHIHNFFKLYQPFINTSMLLIQSEVNPPCGASEKDNTNDNLLDLSELDSTNADIIKNLFNQLKNIKHSL